MAAPQTAYRSKKLEIHDDSGNFQDIYLAKPLLNNPSKESGWGNGYFNSADSAATAIAKIKGIFAVDAVDVLKTIEGEEEQFSFIGLLDPDGTLVDYHSNLRMSGLVRIGDKNFIYLNDAGLNTLAFPDVGSQPQPKWANWINLELIIQSSYYNTTTQYGYSYKIGSGGSWTDIPIASLPRKQYKEVLVKIRDLSVLLEEGDHVLFRAYATNSEGTQYSAEKDITLDARIMLFGANPLDDPDDPITAGITLFGMASSEASLETVTEFDSATGIFMYQSEYFNSGNYVPNGYYIIGGVSPSINGKTKVFYIQSGEVRRYEERNVSAAQLNLYIMKQDFDSELYNIIGSSMFAEDGFPNTITISTITAFYDASYNEVGTKYYKNLTLTEGSYTASTPMLSPPPVGAVYAKTTTNTSQSDIGLLVVSNYTPL